MKTNTIKHWTPRIAIIALCMSVLVLATASTHHALAGPASSSPSIVASMSNQSQPDAQIGSGFTYQGQLKDGGNPANGSYDFQFKLFDASSGGAQVGSTLTTLNQTVSAGLFTTQLDFGTTAYQGQGRWLEIAVRTAGGPTYTTLSPRQLLNATPYASSLMPGAVVTGTTGTLVRATSNGSATSIYGVSGSGYGLRGDADDGTGVFGLSASGYGLYGSSSNNFGIYGISTSNWAIKGSGVSGVWGESTAGYGVAGSTGGGATVSGVYGTSTGANGVGVHGTANNGTSAAGVSGDSTSGDGVSGSTSGGSSGAGVYGLSTGSNGTGVHGTANNGTSAYGVRGDSAIGFGVYGQTIGGVGVNGSSLSGYGVLGTSNGTWAIKGSGVSGVWGEAVGGGGTGVSGTSASGYGAQGNSASNFGVYGTSTSNWGIKGRGTSGVWGDASASNGTGVSGSTTGGVGLHGSATTGWAGWFDGDVYVTGSCCAAGMGTFKIDHPTDPQGKYLVQAAVQSPDVKSVYDGIATLDSKGEATVALPSYVAALNTDFRYQLTCIGEFAPVYIAREIVSNSFKIAGGKAGMKVSWQVTGIRNDPYALAHPIQAEVEKSADEQGNYLHPTEYGQPESKGIDYETNQEIMGPASDKSRSAQQEPHNK